MKKYFILIAMLVLATFAMAQTPVKEHTKPYTECKAIIENVIAKIQEAKDCDELNAALFGFFEVYGVENQEIMTQEENELLDNLTNEMDKAFDIKKAKMGCKDENPENEVEYWRI